MTATAAQPTIDELLARIPVEGPSAVDGVEFPVVEHGRALFCHVGGADAVRLHHWIFGLESAQEFERTHAEVWTLELDIQNTARVEYKLEVASGGEQRLTRDSLNPNLARDPFGSNSVVCGPDYREPWWALEDQAKRHGELLERQLKSDVFGDVRPLSIYLPAPLPRDAPVPAPDRPRRSRLPLLHSLPARPRQLDRRAGDPGRWWWPSPSPEPGQRVRGRRQPREIRRGGTPASP